MCKQYWYPCLDGYGKKALIKFDIYCLLRFVWTVLIKINVVLFTITCLSVVSPLSSIHTHSFTNASLFFREQVVQTDKSKYSTALHNIN